MRPLLGVLLVLGTAAAVPAVRPHAKNVGDLKSLLDEFLGEVNFDQMVALWKEKEAAGDADLMQVIDYLKGPDFKKMYDYMHDASGEGNSFPDFLDYLRAGGLDIDAFEAWLAKELGWDTAGRRKAGLGDFKSLVDEFLALVDLDALSAWFLDKVSNDDDMKALVAELSEGAATAAYLAELDVFQDLLQFMRDDDIDIDAIIDAIKAFLGW